MICSFKGHHCWEISDSAEEKARNMRARKNFPTAQVSWPAPSWPLSLASLVPQWVSAPPSDWGLRALGKASWWELSSKSRTPLERKHLTSLQVSAQVSPTQRGLLGLPLPSPPKLPDPLPGFAFFHSPSYHLTAAFLIFPKPLPLECNTGSLLCSWLSPLWPRTVTGT